jgi:NADH-quinone oxidoreductase subunit L
MQKVGLGWLYEAMRRKFYFDELYHATIIRGIIKLADIFFYFDNRWVVDPIVNLAGRTGRLISEVFGAFDLKIVDGLVNLAGRTGAGLSAISGWIDSVIVDEIAVNGTGRATGWLGGSVLRRIQTGKAQNYLLLALVTVLVLLGLYLAAPLF